MPELLVPGRGTLSSAAAKPSLRVNEFCGTLTLEINREFVVVRSSSSSWTTAEVGTRGTLPAARNRTSFPAATQMHSTAANVYAWGNTKHGKRRGIWTREPLRQHRIYTSDLSSDKQVDGNFQFYKVKPPRARDHSDYHLSIYSLYT